MLGTPDMGEPVSETAVNAHRHGNGRGVQEALAPEGVVEQLGFAREATCGAVLSLPQRLACPTAEVKGTANGLHQGG